MLNAVTFIWQRKLPQKTVGRSLVSFKRNILLKQELSIQVFLLQNTYLDITNPFKLCSNAVCAIHVAWGNNFPD